jgi:hypothetical protein
MPISTIGTNSLGSTAQIGSLTTASGSAPSYSARAWVNFNGTGTVAIRASGNVSSITDNGTGDYTVNFTTALADENYFAAVLGVNNAADSSWTANSILSRTTSGVRFGVGYPRSTGGSSTAVDTSEVGAAIFR